MKITGSRALALALLLILVNQQSVFAQNQDDLDFSELDQVEKEEFGSDNSVKDGEEFDLNAEPKKDDATTQSELDTFDKELEEMESPKSGSETVDLNKELEIEEPEQKVTQPEPPPPLTTPQEQAESVPPPEESPTPPPTEENVAEEAPAPQEQVAEQSMVPQLEDEPNARLEARLNRIYEKFMREKTSDDEWLQKVQGAGERATENYTVQNGDTLWDISVTFFGTGYFWPKIWQLNEDITNPHNISPGKVIRFTPGTLEQAPRINVTDGETEPPSEQTVAQIGAAPPVLAEEVPEIPPGPKSRPVLKNLPPSLPFIISLDEDAYDKEGFSISKQKAQISTPVVPLTGYLSEYVPDSDGEIMSMEQTDAKTASTYQYVYAKVPNAQVGEVYTVIGIGKKSDFKKNEGHQIEYLGTIKITEQASDVEPLYKAIVMSSIGQVSVGAKLTREAIPKVSFSKDGKENSTHGEVIGGVYDPKQKLMADSSVLYLDVGANAGISVGDVMAVIRNDKARNSKSLVTMNAKKIGSIKIAKVTPSFATAIVLQSSDEIVPGDNVGLLASDGNSRELIYYDSGEDSIDSGATSDELSNDVSGETSDVTEDELEAE